MIRIKIILNMYWFMYHKLEAKFLKLKKTIPSFQKILKHPHIVI